VELFERVGMDRISMAFCEVATDFMTWIGCENK
jgi:hypothetical protein